MSRELELGWASWTSFASSYPSCSSTAVQRTLSTDIDLVTLSSTAVETAIAQCTSLWAMARGHRLNTSIVLAAVHGLSGLFRTVSAVEPSLSRPLPTLSPSLTGHLASVDVKQHESTVTNWESRFGLAVRLVSGRTSVRYRFGSHFSSKVVVCGHGLVNLFLTINETLKFALIAAHLNAGRSGGFCGR